MTSKQGQQLKFPPINNRQNVPFKVPNDSQILLENQNSKSRNTEHKIWRKTTSSCRNPLKRFDKFETIIDEKYIPVNSFSNRDKKLIENAMEIIQIRKKNKDLASKNETIVDILEQKKEMFLVTMTHGIIEKQINHMKDEVAQKNKAFKDSNQILDQDIEQFQQYEEKQKNQTKNIEQKYEKQVQKRLAKQQEIKNKQITFNSLRAEKSRNEENISSYEKYKKFLNQLPPKEWVVEQEKRKQKRFNELKQRMFQQWTKDLDIRVSSKRNVRDEFQKYFSKQKESGENQEIEQILNNEEMYFKQPNQLIEYFNSLEEANLFGIQNAQYAEQKYQELKIRSEDRKSELTKKYQGQQDHKKTLEKQLSQLQNQIRTLKKKKQQNSVIDGKDNKDIKSAIAVQYQHMKENMHSYLPQYEQNAESLSLLSGIEICMEKLWGKLRECYSESSKVVKDLKNGYDKKKASEKREQTALNNKIEDERRKIRNLEKKQPTMKMHGRIAMVRSPPADKVVTKKVQIAGKDTDNDYKYFVQ